MNSKFEQIVIFGSGSFAEKCILLLRELNIPLSIYEANTTKIATLYNIAAQKDIIYCNLAAQETFSQLAAIRKQTLIFLLGCNHLLPQEVTNNEFLSIVNYHNALLPRHPGRNAEAWSIFEQDEVTGITWHYVDERIDAGDIILQKEIPISDSITSLALLKKQNEVAFNSLKEIIKDILEDTVTCVKQDDSARGKLHLSSDVPNGGILDVSWDLDKIKAFLRAMDYGALRTMGHASIIINNSKLIWRKVKICNVDLELDQIIYNQTEQYISIIKNRQEIKLIGVTEVV